MKTQVMIIGEQPVKKTKNAIKFQCYLNDVNPDSDNILYHATDEYESPFPFPHSYNFIELICRDYLIGSDLMFAYNDPNDRSAGRLYIGKFNDGVAE